MRALVEDINTRLGTVPGNQFARVWNNQIEGEEDINKQYSIPLPATLVEFVNPQEIKQLGDGVQLYDVLIVRVHILHWQIDAADGTMEQNLDAYDFAQEVYKKLQGWEPDGAVAFVRINEERDFQHKGLYHLIQDYKTNYIDDSMQRSTDGTTINAGTVVPVINAEYDPIKPYIKGT